MLVIDASIPNKLPFIKRVNINPEDYASPIQAFSLYKAGGVGAAALLGNPKAIELAIYYFGIEHVLFGTDVPLGINPAGATEEIIKAIQSLKLGQVNEEKD